MKRISIILITLLSTFLTIAQNSQFHYFCGFETPHDTIGWRFATGRRVQTNFTIGRAARRIGAKSLYVSADGGTTAGYTSTAAGYTTVAYRKFTLEAGTYDINFDLRIAGQAPASDVLRLAYFSELDNDGIARTPVGSSNGSQFPLLARLNPFTDDKGETDFVNSNWKNVSGQLTIPHPGEYWLAFYFKEYGGLNSETNPGACIDNIQIVRQPSPSDCHTRISNLTVTKNSSQINISWQGNASQYELLYYNTSNSTDTTYTLLSTLTSNSHTIILSRIPEGCYNFRVRPICTPDTGSWVEKSEVLVYDPSAHCLDYLNFTATGVNCTSGSFVNPYLKPGIVDKGSESKESMHTVHYRSDEYDRLTGYKLKTVPDGAVASVRLSNWTEGNSPSGSIEYAYTVKSHAKVLLLRYAAVLQYEKNHTKPEEQTRIHVEILDSAGNLLSHCTEADFNALDVSQGNLRGWQTYLPKYGEVENHTCPIKWLDWTTLGINLEEYIGQEVRIRLTLYACVANFHFAYAYFVLDCSRGDIEGMSCGVVPTRFTVSEGFDYKWYKMSDGTVVPDAQLSDGGRTFTPIVGDTCSYFVDLMYPENNACKFTLRAYTLPRIPVSDISYLCRPRDCQNIVEFTNLSAVYSYPKDEPEILRPDTIDSYLWDFGKYGTSQKKNPQLPVPLEGDTFTVILQTGYNNCYDTKEFEIQVPAIRGESFAKDTAYICEGETVVFNGKTYDSPGDYIDTLSTVYGCDSIVNLYLKILVPDTIETDTTICSNEVLDFFGQQCDTTGIYTHHVPSSLGCDSLYYEMHLTILDALEASVSADTDICSSDIEEQLLIPYTVTRGMVTAYSIDYDPAAEAVGFSDTDSTAIDNDTDTTCITMLKPANVRPGQYAAAVTFYNSDCGNLILPLNFTILYPTTVIAQRWNDLLAIRNSEYNGGYTFVAYQWYHNGQPIDGAIRSQYYTAPDQLDFSGEYTVLLTRADDGKTIFTCPYIPIEHTPGTDGYTDDITVTIHSSDNTAHISVSRQVRADLYTSTGTHISTHTLTPDDSLITLPTAPGLYLLRILHPDGRTRTIKLTK